MAEDVSAFIQDKKLRNVTLVGHSMGAKTAMTLALRSPELISNIIAVDNAPLDVALNSDFAKYIRAMKKIQDAKITRQAEADKILQDFEEVGLAPDVHKIIKRLRRRSLSLSGSFFSEISIGRQEEALRSFAFL
ncbi:hypothetical protein E4U41_005530 [Claviceps citrina]|nr:hypothetical protein E4U41_005530 [Claviceps citrina]